MNSRSDPEKKIPTLSLYLALLPVLLCLALMVVLHLASPTHPITRMVFEPPFLLPTLNTIFIFLVGCIVSYLAMRGYLSWGSSTILFFGCGMLSLGSGAFVAGWLIGPWGPNVNSTVFTLSALLSSIFHMAGMIVNVMERPPEAGLAGRRRKLAVAYSGLLALVALVALAAIAGIIPPFFIRGAGPTVLRQVFVATTLALFIITASSMMILFVQKGVRFLYWYSLGLALFVVNTFGAFLQPALGSPLGWVARGSAYLAGIYFLVAVLSASREARTQGIALSERFADIFRKSERKISFIFASMTDFYYELDRQWRFTRINDRCLAYFGRDRTEFIGRLFLDVLPENRGSIFEEQYKLAFSEGIDVHFEVQSLAAPARWVDVHAYPTEEGLSVFIRDITERKQAEIALRESEQRWATTLASIGDAVIATDVTGRIAFMNAVAEELTGWRLMDTATKPVTQVFNIINEQTRAEVENPVTKVLREGMVVGLANHTILVRKDGTEVPIDDSGAPIRDADGETMGVVLVFRDITERKQAEERTEHLASYPQLNPSPVIEVDVSGTITFSNPSSQAIAESLGMGKKNVKALLPHDLDAILKDWDKKNESTLDREVFLADRVFSETVQLVPQFKVARIYARDITDRERAQEALRESEERYRNLFNTMDEGFCIIEMIFDAENRPSDYRFLEVNAAFEKQTGLHDAEGKLMRDLAPDHEAHWFEIYGRIALTGEPLRFVNEARALNRWYDVYAYRIGKAEDRRVAIVFHDITDQKRAEETLRKAHDELEERVLERTETLKRQADLLELAYEAILVRDLRSRVIFWNARAEELYGFTRDEALGQVTHMLLQTRFPVPFEEHMTVLTAEGCWEGELTHTRKDGRQLVVLSRQALQRDESGRPVAIMEINLDITDRKRAEEKIKRYAAQLEVSNRELQDFAFVASHDLQEPLRKIQAFGDQLKSGHTGSLDAEGLDYLDRMQNAAVRMQALIQSLLNYSRVASKAQPFSQIDLAAIAREAVGDLEASIKETGGRVEIGDLAGIDADPTQMRQLFQNLIGNGLKFHRDEKPVVRVHGETAENPGPKKGAYRDGGYRIFIEDNGIGFDEKYLDRIFTPFQRLHGRGTYEGTGIGLAICRKIVERHGGTITAKSSAGKGSTFIVTLPTKQPKGGTE